MLHIYLDHETGAEITRNEDRITPAPKMVFTIDGSDYRLVRVDDDDANNEDQQIRRFYVSKIE